MPEPETAAPPNEGEPMNTYPAEFDQQTMTVREALELRDTAYATGVVDERLGRSAIPEPAPDA